MLFLSAILFNKRKYLSLYSAKKDENFLIKKNENNTKK